jgi:hypothetical protein
MNQAQQHGKTGEAAQRSMRQALEAGAAQLDDITGALKEVVTLFETGALTGPNGDRWRDQVRDKLLPFVDETQTALSELARHIGTATNTGS